jgi:exopolyphosphatase / guanosine-5'-triphosphate,3'-diphosphate pyrophosphatase
LQSAPAGRTLAALGRIKDDLARRGITRFRAVGTEALRLASNRGDFLGRAQALGIEVEVISGEEEARLVRRGGLSGLRLAGSGAILADVGGGSSELITAGGGAGERAVSLPLGCVRLRERFSPGREPDLSDLSRMGEHCRTVLDQSVAGFPRSAALVGLGGTFTTLAAIELRLEVYDGSRIHGRELTGEKIEKIYLRLRELPPVLRRRVPGLEPSRADIIIPGIVIIQAIMARLGSGRVTISDRGLLFGMLEERAEAARDPSPPLP